LLSLLAERGTARSMGHEPTESQLEVEETESPSASLIIEKKKEGN
jgi:hypothetical protein